MKMKNILIMIGITAVAVFSYIVARPNQTLTQRINSVFENKIEPTSFPFQELTIPALRQRSFASNINNKTVYEEYGSYTSYLTSYQSDGLKVNGLLTIPTGVMPVGGWPAIVFIHGYIPPKEYTSTSKYIAYVNALASSGFVVFKIDLRGHGSSEGVAGGGYYAADYVIDTLNAYAALESSSIINPKRIGLWGHSMAGNTVLRSATVRPEIPAIAIWAGAVYSYEDMLKYRLNDASYRPPVSATPTIRRQNKLTTLYGQPNLQNMFWKQFAPISYLNDNKGAIQIHHAIDDSTVNINYSRDLIKALDKTAVKHELFEYPYGEHNISGGSFDQAINRTIEFYKENLK